MNPGAIIERAGEEDEAAVDHLGAGRLPAVEGGLDAPEHAQALALGEPGAEERYGDEQADRVGDADGPGDLDDDGQLDEGGDEEDEDEDECHASGA